jgi:serine/threonine protein kinase
LSLLGQISAALRCIHQHGLVHRDVKPANIMLSQSHDVAKLIDLGTIRWLDDSSQLTEIGTPVYAAPEQYLPSRMQGALRNGYNFGFWLVMFVPDNHVSQEAYNQLAGGNDGRRTRSY